MDVIADVDELENIALAQKLKREKQLAEAKKKPGYRGYVRQPRLCASCVTWHGGASPSHVFLSSRALRWVAD